jgi:hypothetical protein
MTDRIADREQIRDKIFLYAHAIDRRRWDIMPALFHDDAQFQFGTVAGGWRDFIEQAGAIINPLDSTHHQLGNTLISFDGDSADVETYLTAMHIVPPGYPVPEVFPDKGMRYAAVIAGRYIDRFEKRDGDWRIVKRTGLYDWREYREIGEADLHADPDESVGRTDDSDASFAVTRAWRS